jgi:hypothetical protein
MQTIMINNNTEKAMLIVVEEENKELRMRLKL